MTKQVTSHFGKYIPLSDTMDAILLELLSLDLDSQYDLKNTFKNFQVEKANQGTKGYLKTGI